MNDNETDPRTADLAAESAERGHSEPTSAQPVHAGATVQPAAVQPAAPQSAAPQPAAPQWSAPVSSAPQSGTPWQPQSPWQQHPGYHPGYAAQPGYQQHYAPHGAYAGWQQPGTTQTQPTVAGQQAWAPPGAEGQQTWQQPGADQQTWQQPVADGQQTWQQGAEGPQPAWQPGAEGQAPWAQPVGGQPRRPGNGRKILAAGAAAVLIALGAGGVGAWAAMALDDDNGAPTVKTGNSSATRVVDRSSLAQIAASVQDSVVSITTQTGEGSGVILSADGFIVTNNHVVSTAQGSSVTVIFADGKKATASIVGTDERTDLAVVKATGVSGLHAATFGSSAKMEVGDTALAIGSPLGLEGSVTAGIISAKDRAIAPGDGGEQSPFGQQSAGRTMTGLLQTDAPINPGNSGGALVNTSGEVIGINSAIATQGQGSGSIGLGFAIPSDKVTLVAKDLMAGRKVSHPALGVSVAPAENGGALVRAVTANSAAAKAGLKEGDVITAVDGKAIGDGDDLVAAVQAGKVGQTMSIDFTRNGAKQQASATLTEAQ
jgi:putative serine protease PepD